MVARKARRIRKGKMRFDVRRLLGLTTADKSSDGRGQMEFYHVPDPFPKGMPKEGRIRLIRESSERAKEAFLQKYASLQEWLIKYDPIYFLSFCAYYYLSYREGTDPEVTGDLKIPPFLVEILQALSLCAPRNYSMEPLSMETDRLEKELNEIASLYQLSLFTFLSDDLTQEEMTAQEIRGDMMVQTLAIRNWAYPYQMVRIVCDLAKIIDEKYSSSTHIRLFDFLDTMNILLAEMEESLNKHREKVRAFLFKSDYREMINTYNQVFPENIPMNADQTEIIWNQVGKNIDYLKGLLLFHSDLKLERIYSFDIDHFISLYKGKPEVSAVKTLLDKLSFSFGDLSDYKKEYFLLDNVVHNRPFIKISEGQYYSSIIYVLQDLMLGILEGIVKEDEEIRIDYNDRIKSSYLEDEVGRILVSHFPSAAILHGSCWYDPESKKTYENDWIVIVDTFAIVIECKSGNISAPARRGAPLSLFDKLKELIEDPSDQAFRFIAYLRNSKGPLELSTRQGTINRIDNLKINYYVPVGVTLSSFGVIAGNLKKIIEAKIINEDMSKLAMSISLTDLECVLEILNYEAEYIHYFFRRREFDDHVNYMGDELDLLDFYLANGFNIGEAEFDKKNYFLLVNGSKNIDPYFIDRSTKVPKPKHQMTKWWEDILSKLSYRKPERWIETSFILLSTAKEDQTKFESNFNDLKERIKEGKVEKKHNWVALHAGPAERRYMIVGYPYELQEKEKRDSIIGSIIESADFKKIRGIVVIGIDMNRDDYPYSCLAGKLETRLSSL